MRLLNKAITGVVAGTVYPSVIAAGEPCPPELLDHAIEQDALVPETAAEKKAREKAEAEAAEAEAQAAAEAAAAAAQA